jgi:plasmid stabilization system protein ParE
LKRRVRFSAFALAQLEDALDFVAAENPVASVRLQRAIRKRLERLKTFPGLGRVVPELGDPELHEVVVAPYRILYRHSVSLVTIVAVVHGRRDLVEALPEE